MYVFCCSYAHNVAANNKWLAFVSTTVETSTPELELGPGLALLGPVDEKFVEVVDVHEPLADGSRCAPARRRGGLEWRGVGWVRRASDHHAAVSARPSSCLAAHPPCPDTRAPPPLRCCCAAQRRLLHQQGLRRDDAL
jgi:hypothetical protein